MDIVNSVKSLFKVSEITIDNFIFKLHYKATTAIVFGCCLIVTSAQYIGQPITCIHTSEWSSDYINSHCWIHSTYTIINSQSGKTTHGPYKEGHNAEVQYHNYYQWMPLYLVFVGVCFLVPRILWKTWEGGRMKDIVAGLNDPNIRYEERKSKLELRVRYFRRGFHSQKWYFVCFCLSEFLNFLNVIIQILLMDVFLDKKFVSYGAKVVDFFGSDTSEVPDPMQEVFPRITRCKVAWSGPTGKEQYVSAQCLLSQNIINEKIVLFLWFWFMIVAVLSGMASTYRLMYSLFPIVKRVKLRSRSNLSENSTINAVARDYGVGDCWFFQQLGKNLDPELFCDFLPMLDTYKAVNKGDEESVELVKCSTGI